MNPNYAISAVSGALRCHTPANNSTAVYLSIPGGTAAMTADANTFFIGKNLRQSGTGQG